MHFVGQSFWDAESAANHLTWFASSNESDSPTGYRVYRRAEGEMHDTLIATLGTVLSHVDFSASPGVKYFYTIVPFNSGGDGPVAIVHVTTVGEL